MPTNFVITFACQNVQMSFFFYCPVRRMFKNVPLRAILPLTDGPCIFTPRAFVHCRHVCSPAVCPLNKP